MGPEEQNQQPQSETGQTQPQGAGTGGGFKQPGAGQTASKKGGGKGWLWVIIIIIVIAAIVGAVAYAKPSVFNNLLGGSSQQTADGTVAMVNGTEITRDTFNARYTQSESALSQQGQQLNAQQQSQLEQQVLQTLINEQLVLQAAQDADLSVSDQELEDAYQNQVLANFESEEALKEQLAENNSTLDELKDNLRDQLIIQKYLDQNISSDQTAVTDEEARTVYDQAVANAGTSTQNIPSFEDSVSQIKQNLSQQKRSQAIQQLVQQLRQDADIQTYLSTSTESQNG